MTGRNSTQSAKWNLGLLFVVFGLPLFLAMFVFVNRSKFTIPISSYGRLLTEKTMISKFSLINDQEQRLKPQDYLGTFNLVFVLPKPCLTSCQNKIQTYKNLRIALGKNSNRLNLLWLQPLPTEPLFKENNTSLVSPEGQIILTYAADSEAKGILKDIRRLMRLSNDK